MFGPLCAAGFQRTRLQRDHIQFQLKAGKISPKEAGQEVLSTRGTVKEMVRSALEAKGHYTMLCSHPYVRKGIEGRETRIREALRGAGLSIDDVQVGFRDAGQIAAWANHHPIVATWLKEQTQPGAIGSFRSWVHWAGRAEHDGSPWVEDERLPALRARLHEGLTEPRAVVRAVGLSGIGKSRLVLEALGPAAEAASYLHDLVLYADESEVGSPALDGAVQSLADMRARAVVVVDRCPPESHRVLADMVSRVSSRLSLITIDNEMRSGKSDEAAPRTDEACGAPGRVVVRPGARDSGLQGVAGPRCPMRGQRPAHPDTSALVIREPTLSFHQTVDVGRVEQNPHRWLAVQSTVINSEHAAAKRRIVESGHHRIHFFRWGVLDLETAPASTGRRTNPTGWQSAACGFGLASSSEVDRGSADDHRDSRP